MASYLESAGYRTILAAMGQDAIRLAREAKPSAITLDMLLPGKTGWEIRSFPGLRVFHHRPTGTAGTALWRARFRQGLEDYFMGYHPLFEFCKCIRRLSEPPFCIGSALQFCAYIYAALTRQDRVVPDEFVRYLRRAQMRRVLQGLLGVSARIPEYGKSIE